MGITKTGLRRSVQRRLNLVKTLSALKSSAWSVQELTERVNITRPAMKSVLYDLVTLGWVEQSEPELSTGQGRPAARWKHRSGTLKIIGLQICVHECRAMVFDISGNVLAEGVIQNLCGLAAEPRIRVAAKLIRDITADVGLSLDEIAICSVASPGVLDNGVVLHYSGKGIPGWVGVDLGTVFRRELGLQVVVSGDCALGALGESWQGSAIGHDEVVYIHYGPDSIGSAAIIGGRVHSGYRGAAGIVGELPELQWSDIANRTLCAGGRKASSISRMFIRARNGEADAISQMHTFNRSLALGTAALILAIAPSKVVIGGGLVEFANVGLAQFRDELAKICPVMPEVVESNLNNRAIVLGALRVGIQVACDRLEELVYDSDEFPSPKRLTRMLREGANTPVTS